ncbi:hypothetical protein DXG03_002607 [Asterophora parasitica]|uniref:Uncharacterized protein n=1 Tax=Asterophora parasitica TaxID=117018 RepID=A0A9P7G265_9AGAR|nr:hypothetical protein DXG03_002607 [Asterophora parasitica]
MCFVHGSIDQVVAVCPMCTVFPHPRCPHQREVCRNRTLHPRIDVSYLKNAEVDSFNGCGYCKWARTNPPPKHAGFHNPGWPGCCRPPTLADHKLIHAADWRSISIIHHVPIPPDIRAALDSLRSSPVPRNNPTSHSRSPSISPRAAKQPRTQRNTTNSHSPSSSVPTPSTLDQHRRQSPHGSLHSSPKRNNLDLERRTSGSGPRGGPAVTPAAPSVSTTKVVVAAINQSSPVRSGGGTSRRSSVSNTNTNTPVKAAPAPRAPSSPFTTPRTKDPPSTTSAPSSSSSSSSNSGSGSLTDSTITSDGGFTDYLSDESEAELQRQAEARAALLAQNQAEELEFRAARLQLAHVDLWPPRVWIGGAAVGAGVVGGGGGGGAVGKAGAR